MAIRQENTYRAVEQLKMRINGLGQLRELLGPDSSEHLLPEQWRALEGQLHRSRKRLLKQLLDATAQYKARGPQAERAFYYTLGRIEVELAKAFGFFDTYLDILTQRNSPALGPVLKGADQLAKDSLSIPLPALQKAACPLVYCDRGFGASILREGVLFPDGARNPMPLIQIPYARLNAKYHLPSVIHEVGHQALVQLNMKKRLADAFYSALNDKGAPALICRMFAQWSFEIGPDFWAFCASGYAQAAGLKDVLALPPGLALKVSPTDVHPTPYLRVLLSLQWCRNAWGKGIWDEWSTHWQRLYPLRKDKEGHALIRTAAHYFPVVNEVLFQKKFKELGGRRLPDLFSLPELHPRELKVAAERLKNGQPAAGAGRPAVQLAAYRYLFDHSKISVEALDQMMTDWLKRIGNKSVSHNKIRINGYRKKLKGLHKINQPKRGDH